MLLYKLTNFPLVYSRKTTEKVPIANQTMEGNSYTEPVIIDLSSSEDDQGVPTDVGHTAGYKGICNYV